jgi:DNA-binding SARP family transcriptional activator/tetratricopeptide (TPR) repeat protein
MGGLELRFLGEFAVIRDGCAMPLPPSKKTRALLAYLCLNPRPLRREHLCELLWEVPDDPRGSLRWSLSKLRRLLDDDSRTRIVADRVTVGMDVSDVAIDVVALRALAADGLARVSIKALEAAVARYAGNFLEGLEFSDFHDFHAWCVAERESAARAQCTLLRALVERLADAPERALPHARALVGIAPYDEASRAALIGLLVRARHMDEAEQQYQLGMRMLREGGIVSSGALLQARRGAQAASAPTPEQSDRTEPRTAPITRGDAPARDALVGRDAEASQVAEALARVARTGAAEIILVRGEPGIGKSRLLEHTAGLARAAGALLVRASAFESESIRPFALWVDALRALGSDAVERLFGGTQFDNRERLFSGLSDLVAQESARRIVMLMFDDAQWCDESSATALHYVVRTNRRHAVFAVLAARDAEIQDNVPLQQALRGLRHDGLLQELRLGPLAEDAISQIIHSRAPAVDSERLSRECGGNPLLAIELARAENEGAGSGGSLSQLVRERLARLDVDGAELLRWAALLGPRVDVPLLVKLTGLDADAVGAILEHVQRQAILSSSERGLSFSHELIARAIYTDISPVRRQVMHRRVAELMEHDAALDLAHVPDLAHHATQSGDPGLAARAMVSAGRLCLRFFANDDALSLGRRGLQLAERLAAAEQVRVSIDLHDVILSAAALEDWDEAARTYVQLAERALDHGALAHASLGYHMAAYVRWAHGQWAGAREQSLQSERVVRGGSDDDHIVGMAETARCLAMLERDLSQADAMLMEARALAQRRRFTHRAIPAGLGILRLHENRLDEAEELFKEARALCKSAGDRISEFQANEYLVMIEVQRGRFDVARQRCEELLAIGDRLREGSEAPFARALQGLCIYATDDDDAPLDTALADLRIADAKHRLAYVLTRAALVDWQRGRVEAAMRRSDEALGYAQLLERATEMLLAHAVLALGSHAGDEATRAHEHLSEMARLQTTAAAEWARETVAAMTRGLEARSG